MAVINSKYNIGDKVWFVKNYEVEKAVRFKEGVVQ